MTRIIDYELQQQFLVDRVTNVVNELDVRRRLVAFCRSADFESFIVQQLSELKNLDLLVGGDVLDDREALVASFPVALCPGYPFAGVGILVGNKWIRLKG